MRALRKKREDDLTGRVEGATAELHTIRLPKEVAKEVREIAEREFRPFNGQVMYLLRQALRHERLVREAKAHEPQTVTL